MLNLWKPEPKRRAGIVRPAVVPGVSLSRYTNTELGVRIARRSNLPKQDPGVAWARLMANANRPEKCEARDAVLSLFTLEKHPKLSILTFPASKWLFEHHLLGMREPDSRMRHTQIISLERDIAIYRAACHNIPIGSGSGKGKTKRTRVTQLQVPSFASANVRTHKVANFLCCTFEDYASAKFVDRDAGPIWMDAAWLDFNGQLTPSRLSAITRFWSNQLRSTLVVTLMNARTSDWITGRVKHHGSIEQLLCDDMDGSEIHNVMRYGDGAPMIQITFKRVSGEPKYVADRNAARE